MKILFTSLFFLVLAAALEHIKSKPTPHIIGGQEATPHSLPYQALLDIVGEVVEVWYCGGVLISRNYVITTAHCIPPQTTFVNIYLGVHNYTGNKDTVIHLRSSIFTVHENYNSSDIINDIAVVRLPETIDYTDAIQAVPLAKDSAIDFVGSSATVSGWQLDPSDVWYMPGVLHYITATVLTNVECESYYGPLSSSVVCTAPMEGVGICDGDSGDPLVSDGVLIGLAAFTGEGCLGQPIGYTRITEFFDWLVEKTDIEI